MWKNEMEFIKFTQSSDVDYMFNPTEEKDWPEFFECYKDRFPLLLYIVGGNYGETVYDDFCNDQIFRVQTYSNQRRIVAKVAKVYDRYIDIFLSLPITTTHMFCVLRGHKNKADEPKTLEDIVKQNPFPIRVKFAPDVTEIYVGSTREDVKTYATILLTREYTEHFILGNCVINGQVCKSVTVAAISPLISVAPVTGIEGKSPEFFRRLLTDLQASLSGVTYDRTAGNTDITKITSEGTGTGNALPNIDPPLLPVADNPDPASDSSESDDDGYEVPPGPALPPRSSNSQTKTVVPCNPMTPKRKHYENAAIVKPLPAPKVPPKGKKPIPSPPGKPIADKSSTLERKQSVELSSNKRGPLPDPKPSSRQNENLFSEADYMYMHEDGDYYQEVEMQDEQIYTESDVADTVISKETETMTTKTAEEVPVRISKVTTGEAEKVASGGDVRGGTDTLTTTNTDHLTGMSVEDIGRCLQKLRLEKYVDQFSEDMIDGVILGDFTKDIMKEDYGFTNVEQIRLWKFISEGYIPR